MSEDEKADRVAELLAQMRAQQPDATEAEAWLLDRLMGAYGMVRMLTRRSGGTYTVGGDLRKDAYEQLNEWMEARYGWHLSWRDPERKSRPRPRPRARARA